MKKSNWWNDNVEQRIDEFVKWTGNYNKDTKNYCRNYISTKKYKNVIDCGCGLATEYYGFVNDNCNIQYTGLDSCSYLVKINIEHGINMIEADLEQDLPVIDSEFDCVYCQEVLEHLTDYENTVNNFIRIAKKEVIIIWFIKPWEKEDLIDYWDMENLYHNRYNIIKLEQFILSNNKVDSLFWKDFTQKEKEKESVLHIKLK